MPWEQIDLRRLERLHCPTCGTQLSGGLMRQVNWTAGWCVVVITCTNCGSPCLSALEAQHSTVPVSERPIDVDDVVSAHIALFSREWRGADLPTLYL